MKNLKKAVSILLSLLIVMSMMPMSVFADKNPEGGGGTGQKSIHIHKMQGLPKGSIKLIISVEDGTTVIVDGTVQGEHIVAELGANNGLSTISTVIKYVDSKGGTGTIKLTSKEGNDGGLEGITQLDNGLNNYNGKLEPDGSGNPTDPGDGGEDSEDPTGAISITKVVEGVDENDTVENNFEFRITNEKTGKVETVTATIEQSGTIDNLPLGTYTIKEVESSAAFSGYTWEDVVFDGVNESGEITLTEENKDIEITATNKYTKNEEPADPDPEESKGSIQITKRVDAGESSFVTSKDFTFVISSEENDINVEKTVKQDKTITFDNLPLGTYTITEMNADIADYEWTGVTFSGEAAEFGQVTLTEENKDVEITATNKYTKPEAKGTIEITKKVVNEEGNAIALEEAKTFTFAIVHLYDNSAADPITTVDVTVSADASEGKATIEMPLGWYKVYEVTGDNNSAVSINGYDFVNVSFGDWDNAIAGLLIAGEVKNVTAANIYTENEPATPDPEEPTGTISITKAVSGFDEDVIVDNKFEFKISGKDTEGKSVERNVTVEAGKTVTSDTLPLGTYTIEEIVGSTAVDNYTWNGVTFDGVAESGKVILTEENKNVEITATNTYTKKDDSTTTLPDPDVPQGSGPENPEEPDEPIIDEPDVPLAPGPDEPIINDPDVPLGPAPVIEDPDAPLTSTSSEEADPNQPKTGDEAPLALMMGMFLVSVGALGTIVVRRKETEK